MGLKIWNTKEGSPIQRCVTEASKDSLAKLSLELLRGLRLGYLIVFQSFSLSFTQGQPGCHPDGVQAFLAPSPLALISISPIKFLV